jgi:hypothetical protein
VKLVVPAVVASLGLSACTAPAVIAQARTSLGGAAFLQVHLTANVVSSDPSLTKLDAALKALTFDINEQSTTGAAIVDSKTKVNSEVVVLDGQSKVLTLIGSAHNLYANVNFNNLALVPGLGLNSSQLAGASLFLSGRWFELPASVLAKYTASLPTLKTGAPTLKLTPSQVALVGQRLETAVVDLFLKSSPTTLAHGYSVSGSLASLVNAVVPALGKTVAKKVPVSHVPGSYTGTVTTAGTLVTGGTFSVTAPDGRYGNATVTFTATIAHQSVDVSVPSNPTVITPSLIKQFSGNGGGLLG